MPTSATAAHKPTPAKPGNALASRAPAKPAPAPKSAAHAAPLRAPALPPFARPDVHATKPVAAAAPAVTTAQSHTREEKHPAAQPHVEAHPPTARMAPGPSATAAHPRAGAVPGPLKPAALKASTPAPRLAPSAKPKPKLSALGPPKTPAAGGGQPMPAHIQEAIQNSLFVDLSAVRLHASTAAQRKAQSLKARAFTFGNDIFLGHGEHPTDLTLITHEAAHVIQQQSVVEAQAWSTSSNDRFEREANHAAVAVGRGERFEVRERVDRPRVQRLGISDALDYFADKAYNIPGYRMFTIVLGVNPINMQSVERSAANILRAVVEFIPGGALITQALDKYGVFDKVGNWVQDQIDSLAITGASIGKAIMDFLDSLSWRDIFHLGDVWERAKRIFSEPIDRIKNFVVNLLEGIWKFVRDAILKPIAKLAEGTSGWPLLTAVLGSNPITGEKVERNAETLIGGFMKLIHQDEIWENIKKSGAIARAWSWFQGTLTELMGFISQIPDLFKQALKTLEWSDILDLPGGFMKVAGVFGKFLGNFISWAGEKIWNLLEIIFDVVAPSVMPYLRKVGAAFRKIIKDPIGFVRHLVAAAKLGIENFAKNFFDHLKKALIDWLTGSLPGVYIPKAFTLLEFGKFALSVLGISWAQIRAKIVKALGPNGETIMKGIETTFDVVVALVTGGPAAAWEVIKDKLTNLKDMVIDGIVGFVEDTIIKKAIPKLVSLFIPGAGFISAIVSIYDTVMVFVQKLAKIAAVVKSFVDGIVDIANGKIEGAAAKVEGALEGLLSLVISFLAGFLGLGNIASKILGVIEKVRAAVDKALDTAITWIVTKAKALFAKLFGAKDKAGKNTKNVKVSQPASMHGTGHTVFVEVKDGKISITIASRLEDLRYAVIGAINQEKQGAKRTDLLNLLNQFLVNLKSTEESITAAIANNDPELESRMNKDCSQLATVLIDLGNTYGLTDLANLGHPSKYVKDGEIAPNFREKKFRPLFYGSWNSVAEAFRTSQLKALKAEATDAKWKQDPLFGNKNAFVVRDRKGTWTPYLDDASAPANTPLDHVEEVAQQWNSGAAGYPPGNNSIQDPREKFNNDTANLQVINREENSRKSGPDRDYKVGKDFRGPGE